MLETAAKIKEAVTQAKVLYTFVTYRQEQKMRSNHNAD